MSPPSRVAYLGNLRILLAGLVILHHAAITQGAPGSWFFVEQSAEGISAILLTLFTAVNQSFFMGGFFLLAGYFAASSYDRHGPARFTARRLLRLGLPLVFYAFVLAPALEATLRVLVTMTAGSFLSAMGGFYRGIRGFPVGPLWFVETLLVLSIAYVLFRVTVSRGPSHSERRDAAPDWHVILAFGVVLGAISFLVRLAYPTGRTWAPLGAQLGYYTQYVALFICGAVARRRGWLDTLQARERRRFGWIALAFVALMPPLFLAGVGPSGDASVFFGGLTWQAAAYALWDQLLGLSVLIWLLLSFREKLDRESTLSRELTRSTYGAFILHAPLLVLTSIVLRGLVLPPIPKFLLTGAIAVPLCFLATGLVRRLPLVRSVI